EHHSQSKYFYGQDIGATALSYLCWALWHLGYVDQAAAVAAEGKKSAEAVCHSFSLGYTIFHARGIIGIFRRCPGGIRPYGNPVISICAEHDFPFWAAGGRILDGWAIVCQGKVDEGIEKLDEGLAAWRKTGARLWLPIFLALKAEAHAKVGRSDTALNTIEEAVAISDETGERWAVAEVLRIKAGLLQAAGRAAADEIENLLIKSLETARRQQALSWQLRTACDLVRLRQGQGRGDEGLTLLQSIYDRFTEGFGTADLIRAEALLESLERVTAIHDDTAWSKFFPISVNRGHQRRTRWARSCSSSTRRSLPQNILSPRKKVGTPKAPRSNARRALSVTRSLTALLLMASPNSRTSSLMRDAIAVQVCSSISSLLTNTA